MIAVYKQTQKVPPRTIVAAKSMTLVIIFKDGTIRRVATDKRRLFGDVFKHRGPDCRLELEVEL